MGIYISKIIITPRDRENIHHDKNSKNLNLKPEAFNSLSYL